LKLALSVIRLKILELPVVVADHKNQLAAFDHVEFMVQ